MNDSQRSYATAKHPTIEALVLGLYRYKDRADVLARFNHIGAHFVLSKDQPKSSSENPLLLLWIKGFGVTPEEEKQGYTGHFAQVEIATVKDGLFTLTASRIDKPITQHPQKKRLQSKHPNWGHPIMRAVKKKKLYPTVEAAYAELELLHIEYPDVSIPGPNKLYIIVYEKREGVKQPTHKIALEVKNEGSKFFIESRDNEKTAAPASKQPPSREATPETEQKGEFTAREALRKKKRAMKRKRSDPRVSKKTSA
jgi:hypothetical protein